MEGNRTGIAVLVSWVLVLLLQFTTLSFAWNSDGHTIICNLAHPLLTPTTMGQVNTLMNGQFQHNFSTLCTWGDEVQFLPQYSWSPPLHSINTPDNLCNYNYTRDCVGVFGEPNFCASGAIKNYTSQLVDPNSTYNKTESLLFLSSILGDIHQPLRCGFIGDGGGAFLPVWWMNTQNGSRTNLFSVWDTWMTHEAFERYYNQTNPTYNETLVDILGNMSLAIYANLTVANINAWSPCPAGPASCPDVYATESIQLACQNAYPGVPADQILADPYFSTRLPVVEQRLLQAAVRLASTLNRIFDPTYVSSPLPPSPNSTAPAPAALPIPAVSPVPAVSSVPGVAPVPAIAPAPSVSAPVLAPATPAPTLSAPVRAPATPAPILSVPLGAPATPPTLSAPVGAPPATPATPAPSLSAPVGAPTTPAPTASQTLNGTPLLAPLPSLG